MGPSERPPDDLRTRLLEIARARERNAKAIWRVSQQLVEVRAMIRQELEAPWSDRQGGGGERRERVKHLVELLLQNVSAQEELGSQSEAGLAMTARLRSVLKDLKNQRLDVTEVLTHIDQMLRHDA